LLVEYIIIGQDERKKIFKSKLEWSAGHTVARVGWAAPAMASCRVKLETTIAHLRGKILVFFRLKLRKKYVLLH